LNQIGWLPAQTVTGGDHAPKKKRIRYNPQIEADTYTIEFYMRGNIRMIKKTDGFRSMNEKQMVFEIQVETV
jgi:hypothetical protein